jgi:site-specific recombinase XerD
LYVSISAIRDFTAWLQLDGRIRLDWATPQFPRRSWKKKACPDLASVRKFLLGLDGAEEPIATLLYLLPHCGLRVHECCKLRLDELVVRDGNLDLEFVGKGGKPRVGLVAVEARARMVDYLRGWRGGRGGPWLFPVPSRTDYHVTEDMVRSHMKRIQKALKIPEMTPHRLRAYYATKLIEGGVDTQTVMQLMGHSNEATLAIYVQQSPEVMRRKVSKVQIT